MFVAFFCASKIVLGWFLCIGLVLFDVGSNSESLRLFLSRMLRNGLDTIDWLVVWLCLPDVQFCFGVFEVWCFSFDADRAHSQAESLLLLSCLMEFRSVTFRGGEVLMGSCIDKSHVVSNAAWVICPPRRSIYDAIGLKHIAIGGIHVLIRV